MDAKTCHQEEQYDPEVPDVMESNNIDPSSIPRETRRSRRGAQQRRLKEERTRDKQLHYAREIYVVCEKN